MTQLPDRSPGLPAGQPRLLLRSPRSRSQHLNKGDIYFITGAAQLHLVEGRVTVVAVALAAGDHFSLPRGRALPVEAVSDAVLHIQLGEHGSVALLSGRTIPGEWDDAITRIIAEKKRTLLLLGGTDTGKTFFASYLANRLAGMGTKTAVLDCDTGQSVIGPPGTIGLAVLERPALFLNTVKPLALYYTGAYSPGSSFLEFAMGVARMNRKADLVADTVIVNTPGWVDGVGGRQLVRAQIELVSPDLIVLLQRENELDHVARLLPGRTVTLPVPSVIPPRSSEDRRGLREAASKAYFRDARDIAIPFRQVVTDRCFFLSGLPLQSAAVNRHLRSRVVLRAERLGGRDGALLVTRRPLSSGETALVRNLLDTGAVRTVVAGDEKNALVSLNDKSNNALALAIIKKIEYARGKFHLFSPLPARLKSKVRIVQFGQLRLTPGGEEAGTIEPGYF